MSYDDMPVPNWSSAWAQLRGYFLEASHDQNPINADDVLAYMAELRAEAFREFNEWLSALGAR